MEHFVIIVNGFQPLTVIPKSSILDVAAILDPPLIVILFYELNIFYMYLHINYFALNSTSSLFFELWCKFSVY